MQLLEQLACGYNDNITTESITMDCASIQGYLECMMEMDEIDVVTEGIDFKAMAKKLLTFIKSIFEKIRNLFGKLVSFIKNIGKRNTNSNKTVNDTINSMSKNGAFSSEPVSPATAENVIKTYGTETNNAPKIGQMTKRDVTEMILKSMKYSGPCYSNIAQAATNIGVIVDAISWSIETLLTVTWQRPDINAKDDLVAFMLKDDIVKDLSNIYPSIQRRITNNSPILDTFVRHFGNFSTAEDIQKFVEYATNRTLYVSQLGYVDITQICDGVTYIDLKLTNENVDKLSKQMKVLGESIKSCESELNRINDSTIGENRIKDYQLIVNLGNVYLMTATKVLSSTSSCMNVINTHASKFEAFIKEVNNRVSAYMK